MEGIKKGTTIQSLEIGMSIVDLIAKQGKPLKFSDIQDLTKITKSNLYKYLNTLTQLEILYRDKDSGAYVLGSKLIEYGMIAADQENAVERIAPYLQEINEKSLNTVLYSVWTQNGPMIVREFKTNQGQGYNIGAQIGTFLPLLSATGKVFATFMDDHIIREWKEKELKQASPEKAKHLDEEYKSIREKEISFAREPLVSSVSSVSFPVFDYKKDVLGAVTIVGFSELIPHHEEEELSKYLINISKEISRTFGYK
ncbi:IclR family transcriptional regulator C-terminal domain-containing protein [Priestia filamentosa]|uniref:IclR family transcriptional regulator n=1 Tax=Priestia filamentosa TaxID=1402861 RepID=UPI0002F95BE2|nr:IclR family transcriptional regulator C-terminal domain-containing protein [Priestia filamentosa]